MYGIAEIIFFYGTGPDADIMGNETVGFWLETAWFFGRVTGTCAVFYILFLCRMLGAGDIKLMALCTGILGLRDGTAVIFAGLFPAAVRAAYLLCTEGIFRERMVRLSNFVISSGRDGKIREYPGRLETKATMHLGPYLFGGYCFWLMQRC